MTDIAIFVPSLNGGGAERVMVILANEFAARGLKVDLIVVKAEGPYLSEISPSVRVVDLKAKRAITSLPAFIRYLRKSRPKAMLSALDYANVIATIARTCSMVSMRLIVSERSNLSSALDAKSIRMRILVPLMWWAYRKADGIVAVSIGVAEDLARVLHLPRGRVSVVYNPVVRPELIFRSQEPLHHPWLESGAPPVILGVGRFHPAKDFPTLIRAFAKVRAECDCRLVILGEGELRTDLERLIQELGLVESVLLPGFAANPYAWMSRAAVFVLSSAWEGLPNALIEAMACGVPVVSTNCPSGPYEILEGGKWGRLVPVGDKDACAREIKEVLREDFRKNAKSRAMMFSLEESVQGYLVEILGR
ncbi:glycosyltransferase involved in cell wall biosynthesis [Variovorax boronicumulans]|uniref:glycosyltransferase n=1 Tax=Variovorax boronicumulans TaxID=436515 RepID=UPI00278919A0|nr:glycosyltransferase [Variovorax boronicumulans]MDP9916411.1 glycosyltransferase involved in cell wall biosynthesis [Variovorax boronicumulans]